MADLQPDSAYAPERFPKPEQAVEFAPDAEKQFQWILSRYPTKEAALLPTLHLAQEIWGWCSPEVMLYVAQRLELTPATVFGVVSFYNMYNQKPVGRHLVQVCTNLSCMLRNAYDFYEHCHKKFNIAPGEITPDGKFTYLEVECLGSCDTAPMVQINNAYHENLTIESFDRILDTLD